jgi:hypothetical protein
MLTATCYIEFQPVQYPFGEISSSPGINLHPPKSLSTFPGTNSRQAVQLKLSIGVLWYFNCARTNVLGFALACRVIATSGIRAMVVQAHFKNLRRVMFVLIISPFFDSNYICALGSESQ